MTDISSSQALAKQGVVRRALKPCLQKDRQENKWEETQQSNGKLLFIFSGDIKEECVGVYKARNFGAHALSPGTTSFKDFWCNFQRKKIQNNWSLDLHRPSHWRIWMADEQFTSSFVYSLFLPSNGQQNYSKMPLNSVITIYWLPGMFYFQPV